MYIAVGQTSDEPDVISKSQGITGSFPLLHTLRGTGCVLFLYYLVFEKSRHAYTLVALAAAQYTENGKKLEVVWDSLLHWLSDMSDINKDILGPCILSGNQQSQFSWSSKGSESSEHLIQFISPAYRLTVLCRNNF